MRELVLADYFQVVLVLLLFFEFGDYHAHVALYVAVADELAGQDYGVPQHE